MANLSPEIALLWFATLFCILCMIDGSNREETVGPPPELPPSLELLERLVDKEGKSDEGINTDSVGPPPEVSDDGADISIERRTDKGSESDETVENDNAISSGGSGEDSSELDMDSEQYSYSYEEPPSSSQIFSRLIRMNKTDPSLKKWYQWKQNKHNWIDGITRDGINLNYVVKVGKYRFIITHT